ncbi:MAG: excinuclease ABC subunit C [Pontibacterium sp.]
MRKSDTANSAFNEKERNPLLSDSDINYILLNGAQIALSKLKHAQRFDVSLFYYAEIGAYLEVSLSRGAGITDETRKEMEALHREATREHMQHNKSLNAAE